MMNDRKLLELAAKAAGIDVDGWIGGSNNIRVLHPKKPPRISVGYEWNPLKNDGDALRLAVKLGILFKPEFLHFLSLERFGNQDRDDLTATRRAIVRAAAEIGKATP